MKLCKRLILIGCICLMGAASALAEGTKGFTYDDKGKRDPLWPLVSPSGNIISYGSDFMVSDLVLEGIMSGGGDSGIAMINGKIVGVNDKIGQFVVVQIQKDAVVLKKGEQTYTLRLKKED